MIQGPSQLQLAEKTFPLSTFGLLPLNWPPCLGTSQLLNLFACYLQPPRAQPCSQPVVQVPSFSLPSLRVSLWRWGRNPRQEGGGVCSCRLREASPRFLGPLPPRKLRLTLSRDVPGTARVSDCSCQPQASVLGSPKEVRGPELGVGAWRKKGAAHSFLLA